MAAGQKKKNGSRNENDNKAFRPCMWCVWVVAVVVMIWNGDVVVLAAAVTTNVTMVVEKTLISGPCMDSNNAIVGDQAEWSTGCNKIVCHEEPSGNYTVTHGCRDLVPSENPDDLNCITIENTNAAYPDCCPYLDCGSASGLSTIDPTACVDVSKTSSCLIWKELTNNCTDTTAFVYNLTLVYCRYTCGYCSSGTG
ncbi:uncharacterized protein LOC143294994 [Babylonia areolata]|uniref:uncharacterized protein LOC143294994 n=1 Tax=Babylonia areolata TaxID=304850 RepID=UPI003FD438CB